MLIKKLVIFGILSIIPLNEAYRILVVFPLGSRSHSILGQGFVTHLLDAGHEVVHITSYPRDKPVANLKEISVAAIMEKYKEKTEEYDMFKLKNMVGKGNIGDSLFFLFFPYDFHKQLLNDTAFKELLTDPKEKFDAVVIEWFFHDAIAGIAPLLRSPLIWVGSTEAHWQVLNIIDEIPNPTYAVDIFSTNTPPMSFWGRIVELWTLVKKFVMIKCLLVPFEKFLYNGVFSELAAKRGVSMPSYDEAVYNASFLLLNSHPSFGTPYKLPQNAKYIGGYHIDSEVKPLPENLQQIMDRAEHGVIYFSMGSNLRSADMSDYMRNSLLKMFGKLKETVMWKFEDDLDNVPANVHLVKWAPQQSILAHPNLKMFITHGGQLSTTEAVHYGVPLIGIPVMADQHVNMMAVVQKEFALKVTLAEDLAEPLHRAIKHILNNPSFKTKAKEISMIYHDRPVSPGAELVHWVEHVVRTRGAPHLRSPASLIPWYQKNYLDLAIVLIIIIVILIFTWNKIRNSSSLKNKPKVKRN